MSEIKLLPCPFCGGEVRLSFCDEEDGLVRHINYEEELECGCSFIHCYNCGMDFFPNTDIAREVVEEWNTRKPVEDVLERLEAECIKYKNEWNTYDDEIAFGQMNGMSNAISIIKEGLME